MSLNRYAHLLAFALDTPWALAGHMREIIGSILVERVLGKTPDPDVVAAAIAARRSDTPPPSRGGVGVLPIYGVLAPRANLLTESSGGTSFEALGRGLRAAVANPEISTIVLDIDSPGGSVAGATEFAAQLRAARAVKPIVAVCNFKACSAAYWIAAQATKIHAAPSADVGSIGCFTYHDDLSEALAKAGIKRTYIGAGKYKLETAPTGPLTDEAKAYAESVVAMHNDRFVADVAKGRNVTPAAVRSGYGEGRTLSAQAALDAGMVDKIATLDETIERLLPAGATLTDFRAEDTAQDPARDTAQDPTCDPWRAQTERALFAFSLP